MVFKNKIFLSLVALSAFLASNASAFSISPLKYFYTLAPGDKQDISITTKNDSDQPKEYIYVVTGLKQDVSGRSIFADNIDLAENWIQNKNEVVAVPAKNSKDIIFTLTIPKNSPPGAHYLGLGVQEKNDQAIGARLLTLVTFQVSGTAQESLDLEKLVSKQKYYFDKNWSGILSLKNTGNIDLDLTGQLRVYGPFNSFFSNAISFGNKLFVQSQRDVKINFTDNSKWLWPGKYYVQVSVGYGLTKQVLNAGLSFWYCPKWILIVLGLVLFAMMLKFIYKRVKNEVAV